MNRSQPKLPGWEKVEQEWDAELLEKAKRDHAEWAASLLRSMVEHYPPSAEECELMLSGIRLSRFVSHLECENCKLATSDHTLNNMFCRWTDDWGQYIPIKFCLKDFYRKFPGAARERGVVTE